MENRHQKLMLETDRHRISGQVTLAREGYRSRISDMLNASERDFIALTDVTVEPFDGGEPHNVRVHGRRADEDRLRGAAQRLSAAACGSGCSSATAAGSSQR